MHNVSRLVVISTLALAISGCGSSSWVQVTPAGMLVSVAAPSEVRNCTRVGTSNVNALDRVAFVQRGSQKLQDDLVNLARNEAGDIGGNRVVPESTIDEGRQTFGVYRCP